MLSSADHGCKTFDKKREREREKHIQACKRKTEAERARQKGTRETDMG